MASPTSVRHQPSATGFQAVAVVAAMTITTAITMGAHAAATQPSAQISPSVHQIVRLLAMGAAPQVTSAAYPHVRRLIGQ